MAVVTSLPFSLRSLADRYDAGSRQVYLSVYADLLDEKHPEAMAKRHREIRCALGTSSQKKALDTVMARALEALGAARSEPRTRAVAVFAGPDGYVEAHALQARMATRVVYDSSPYIAPLARYADDNESSVLVLMDSERAAIFVVWAGRDALRHELETTLIGRHKHGGMSQMRFQRHRQGQVDRFYDYVGEHLIQIMGSEDVHRIAVAGPGPAKHGFVARLPQALRGQVLAVQDADFKDAGVTDDALVRRCTVLMQAEEAKQDLAWVEALRKELLIGDLATTSALECARMAAAGRVGQLLVLAGTTVPGAKCEAHQEVFTRSGACHCGSAGTPVDLVNEADEFTARSDGTCEFVQAPNEFLAGVGGVGAILRW
ncbi:MAG TPA: Vms1/Ankzf1 family peptidyl-tRNA hydrolase [Candidatus Thermoplasmatota archaeon]|nr:Vms1/Ankzf1 family peptidyl-tRNA hydrolase [Candidatus Thermoplasmatota archaeon]